MPGPSGGGKPEGPGVSSNAPKDMSDPDNKKMENAINQVK